MSLTYNIVYFICQLAHETSIQLSQVFAQAAQLSSSCEYDEYVL